MPKKRKSGSSKYPAIFNKWKQQEAEKQQPVLGVATEVILQLKTDLFQLGYDRAITIGDTRVDQDALNALQEHAEAMARDHQAAPVDQENNPHDKARHEQYVKARKESEHHSEEAALAGNEVRTRRDAAAQAIQHAFKPVIPWLFAIFCTLAISFTLCSTIQSLFFSTLDNPRHAWFISFLAGALIGAVLSWALLGSFEQDSPKFAWMGLAAGLVFGISFLLIRLTSFEGPDGWLMALGLALLECSVVLAMDWIGRGLRAKHAEYQSAIRANASKEALLASALEEEASHLKARDEAEAVKADYIEHLRAREHQNAQIDSLVRSAVKTVTDGFYSGLSTIKGQMKR